MLTDCSEIFVRCLGSIASLLGGIAPHNLISPTAAKYAQIRFSGACAAKTYLPFFITESAQAHH